MRFPNRTGPYKETGNYPIKFLIFIIARLQTRFWLMKSHHSEMVLFVVAECRKHSALILTCLTIDTMFNLHNIAIFNKSVLGQLAISAADVVCGVLRVYPKDR